MTHLFLTHKANPALSFLTVGAIMLLALASFHSVAKADVKFFTVSTNADPIGPGAPFTCIGSDCPTLRAAINSANDHPNDSSVPDVIRFNIPDPGFHSIHLSLPLPDITDPVIIDGTSQPGFAGAPLIQLDGTNATSGQQNNGLTISTQAKGRSIVKGLIINHFGGAGIALLDSRDSVIVGNYIGTNSSTKGTAANQIGILISDSPNTTVGGADHDSGVCNKTCNVISGNSQHGIQVHGLSTGTKIQGNFIGTDVSGAVALGNGQDGVLVDPGTPAIVIGGTDHDAGQCNRACNLISANNFYGVELQGGDFIDTTPSQVQGNFIGTSKDGTCAPDSSGKCPLGNRGSGVFINNASRHTIGGVTDKERNLISGNHEDGVAISGIRATGNKVQGNFIGTDAGNAPVPNDRHGVEIYNGAAANFIGGKDPGASNTIAFNGSRGVAVTGGAGNAILGNSIFSNTGLGIDLGSDGVTGNNTREHIGPNHYQNFPELTSATNDGTKVTITGTLTTVANATLRIEFFADTFCDSSGNGQGDKFLGFKKVTTDSIGDALDDQGKPTGFTTVIASQNLNSSDKFLTATATTDPGNDTSEFSACAPIKSTTGCQGTIAPPNSRSASPATPALLGSSTALPPPRAIQAACTPDTSLLQTDDGSFEQPIGFPNGASTAYFVNRITPPVSARYPFKLQKLEIFFGNRSNGLKLNDPITLLVGTNDSGGSNINGTTFSRFATTVGFLNQWNIYDLSQIADPNLILASGDFVVGFEVNNSPNVFPADEDTSSSSRGRSYISTDGSNFTLIDSFTGLAGNFGIRAEILPVFAEGEICNNLTVSVKPSGSPKPVVFKPTIKKVAKQSFSVTVTNKTGVAQTVSNLDALLGEPFEIVSISPALPRLIKNGKKQKFTVKTQRAAGLGTATATAPFFFTQTSCGLLPPAGLLAQPVPFDSQGVRLEVRLELQEGQLRLQVSGTGMESVRLELFDLSGRKLLDRTSQSPVLTLAVAMDDGTPLANGVYLYVISGRSQQGEIIPSEVRKLIIRR